ncbi:MAG: hypothetical protein ABW069_22130, partial [Duganella sp.]
SGILKRNDAIFLCSRAGRLFIFLMEMKQGNKSDYLVQLKAGKIFMEFLLNLLLLHGKCDVADVSFFGLLCYGPARKTVDKESTRRGAKFEFEDRNGLVTSNYYSEDISLGDLINAAKRWTDLAVPA